MTKLYPLKFTPVLKDKIWGGYKLEQYLNKTIAPLPNAGESWEISGVPGMCLLLPMVFLLVIPLKKSLKCIWVI